MNINVHCKVIIVESCYKRLRSVLCSAHRDAIKKLNLAGFQGILSTDY